MESLIKQTLIAFLIVSGLMFGVSYLVNINSNKKDNLQKELANQIYHSKDMRVVSCNFTTRYNNQVIHIISLSPLKIQFGGTVYLYPGVWSMEYNNNNVFLKNGTLMCQGVAQ